MKLKQDFRIHLPFLARFTAPARLHPNPRAMQVIGSLRSARKLQADQAAEDSLERLSLYTTPPQHEISLDEFEQFAIDRLQVLKKLEMLKAQGARGLDLKLSLIHI